MYLIYHHPCISISLSLSLSLSLSESVFDTRTTHRTIQSEWREEFQLRTTTTLTTWGV